MLTKADDYISGEDISQRLGVTRAAVWKYIEDLRRSGYVIEALPRRGYRLVARPDKLLPTEIRAGLTTDRFGHVVHYFPQIGSTNDQARQLARQGAAEGTIVVAEEQTAGRGRRGRAWVSQPGSGIFVSLILRPNLIPAQAPLLTLTAAVAGAEAIRQLTGLPAVIKWPNDLYVDGRKVAGILTEMSSEMDTIFYVVVGIGINVNTSSFPTEVSASATSLALEQGRSVCRRQLLQLLLEKLEYWYQILSADQDQILERWRQLTITLGKRVSVYSPNFTVHGLALDIDHEGALLLETETGEKVKIFSGDVSLR
ncbi:MAG: biotin--[acetyl-CoA-carboxylase] ligase [Firmicutes bacterium]|nr:biotin--[acetyl-CoA-carboxylase] ligase [Bacillota bacterium]